MMTTQRATEGIRAILQQGGDPRQYRTGLAQVYKIPVESIDALIAEAGAPRQVHPETVAQERLAEDARQRREQPAAWRAANHEE